MTIKAFQKRIVARLRKGLKRTSSPIERLREASLEALDLCGRHGASIPDRAVSAFERRHAELWRSPGKGATI